MKIWIEKYRPETFEEVVGQDEAIKEIKEYLAKFPKVKRKAILLGGSPGVGKTTLALVAAKETSSELFELNASDFRNKSSLNEKLKPVLEQTSLFNKNKIILIDEIDGLSGNLDRGGLSEILLLIDKSPYPIICTANDLWSKNVSNLKKKCELIELKEISPAKTKEVLKRILEKENRQVALSILNKISISSRGDLRSAINDLESLSLTQVSDDFQMDERNKKNEIFQVIKTIFQEKADYKMLSLYDSLDMPLDEIFLWLDENISKVYQGEDLYRAYLRLSLADIFKGRIYKKQYWRFLVYENQFLSYGISQAKGDREIKGFFKYSKPERILKIWLNNIKTAKKQTIAEKFSKKTHVGKKRILKEWKEVSKFLKNPEIQKELKLEKEEIEYLNKY